MELLSGSIERSTYSLLSRSQTQPREAWRRSAILIALIGAKIPDICLTQSARQIPGTRMRESGQIKTLSPSPHRHFNECGCRR
jgi:hypothetical protein